MSPPDRRQRLGRAGERLAERALTRAGMRVLERRFRSRSGEIDLIVEHDELLVFVEVKTRRGVGFGRPAEAVTATKRRRMARAALAWLTLHGASERPCRFDVVEVLKSPDGEVEVRHVVDAFRLWRTG